MKNAIVSAGLALAVAVAVGSHAQAATVAAPQVTSVWWGGPSTVCFRRPYGAYCRPARSLWMPRYYRWNRFWVPGHWQ